MLFASLLVTVLALTGTTILFRVIIVRTMGMETIGRLAYVEAYVGLILSFLLPTVLLAVLIKLSISRYRTVRR